MHVGIVNPRWRGKRSPRFQRMRNPQFCVSGMRPMVKVGLGQTTTKHNVRRNAMKQCSHNYRTQVLGSIPFTPSLVTKWHDRHRYLSIHHVPYLMSLGSPRHCSKTLTPGFVGLGKDNCKTRREAFKFGDLVRLILEILRYFTMLGIPTLLLKMQYSYIISVVYCHWHSRTIKIHQRALY